MFGGVVFDALGRLRRNAHRVAEVVGVVAKYGLADGLRWLDLDLVQDRLRSADGQRLREQTVEARIRMALAELGTTFIKLGQVLSTRPDLVGTALAAELALLQASTTPDPAAVARQTLIEELGAAPEDLFATFDSEALASASIAQVHGATLPSGEAVVVKIMRQGVRQQVETDLEILQALAALAEQHAAFLRPYQPAMLVRQFQRTLRRELDFAHERANLQQFARRFAGDPGVHFPAVHERWCTGRVLTMERLDGVFAADRDGLRASGADLAAFARRGGMVWLEMIFRDAFYHADPHPGNLMLLRGGVLGVLDCGMVGRLDQDLRQEVEDMLLAAVQKDSRHLAEVVLRVGRAPVDTDRQALQIELDEFLDDFVHHDLADVAVGAALGRLLDLVQRYHVVLPAPLSLLLRTLIVLEGTSRALDRRFSLAELAAPFYRQAVRRRWSPRRVVRRLRRSGRDWQRLLEALPGDLHGLLDRLRSGSLRVRLDHQNLDAAFNRLILGVLVAALWLGSSALWTSPAPPRIWGVSLLGLFGYLLAAWLGFRLWRAARRSGRRDR